MAEHRLPGVALYGPTSSGKTSMSLDVAERVEREGLRPVVLNADSRQIYTAMDIGTSKIRPSEMRGIEHRLLDIADPIRKMSLERYLRHARTCLLELAEDRSVVPIVVGGTGVYVEGIVSDWDVDDTEAGRRTLEAEFPRGEAAEAYRLLHRIDPKLAARVHPNNYDAIINALVRATSSTSDRAPSTSPYRFVTYGLDRGVEATEERIVDTLEAQLAAGLLDEIAALDARLDLIGQLRQPRDRRTSVVLDTHGYREFVTAAAAAGVPIAELAAQDVDRARWEAIGHIVAFSRRQRSWTRKQGYTVVGGSGAAQRIVADLLRRRPPSSS